MQVRSPRTFDAAVKHLFRHLHDSQWLQTNPIAEPFFERANASAEPQRVKQALAELRGQVMAIAERLRAQDATARKGKRSARQVAIVTLHCFDRVPMEEVATRLNVSVKHCYREQAAMCRRIARELVRQGETDAVVTETEDGFYVLLDRLLEHAETTKADFEACEYLQRLAQTTLQRLAALAALTDLAIRVGDGDAADAACRRARAVYDREHATLLSPSQRTVEAFMSTMAWRRAQYRGQPDRAIEAAERGVACLERGPIERTAFADQVYLTAHFNLATLLWSRGELVRAYDVLAKTAGRCDRSAPSSPIRIQFEGTMWKLRTWLRLSNTYSSETRIEGLVGVRDRAMQSGTSSVAVDAMVAVTECHVFAKCDAQALQSARATLALAASAHPMYAAETSIELCVRLLATKFWREALPLFPAKGARMGTYHRNLLAYAKSLAAFRAGHFEQALNSTAAAVGFTPSVTLDLRRVLLAAESSYQLGRKAQAYQAAETALISAERLGAAPLLRDAYAVSARVLGRAHAGAQAEEIARILAA